jgi:hypothetical protein
MLHPADCQVPGVKFQASSVKLSGVATVRGRVSATTLRLHWWRSQPRVTSIYQHKGNASLAEGGNVPGDRLAKSNSGLVARVLDACSGGCLAPRASQSIRA